MGKATILEAQNSDAVFENGKTKGVLGKLKGVFADFTKGTRNSDRLYSEELWDKCIFENKDVMEALNTKTLFGELDHPEGDRCETLAKNAAISITKLEKRPNEGVIYGEAEILDTPTGRTLYSIAQTGAKFGISSRGIGEEIMVEGQNIIDPDTYDFITFDVVVTPANEKARVSLTESKQRSKLLESLTKEINESETINQLNQIKSVVSNIQTTDKQNILKLIENKIKNIDNVSKMRQTKLESANKQIAIDLMKSEIKKNADIINESSKAFESLSEENTKLIEQVQYYKESRETLKSEINELAQSKILSEQKVKDLESENSKLQENAEHFKNTLSNIKLINNRKVENLEKQYKDKVAKLTESLTNIEGKYAKLLEANNELSKNLAGHSKILLENSQLKAQVKLLKENINNNKVKLQESKQANDAEISKLKSRIKELEDNTRKMQESEERFSKLSFNPISNLKLVREGQNLDDEYDEEDKQLFNILTEQ